MAGSTMLSMIGAANTPKVDSGLEDLGDPNKLDIQKILDAEREDVRDAYVLWDKRGILSAEGQEYAPIVKVVGIGEVMGRWRIGQEFFEGEREMMTQSIANQLSQLIWGVDMFVEKPMPSGVKFKTNPKFRRLPVSNRPINLRDVADTMFESALPLTCYDGDGKQVRLYAVTEVTSWDGKTEMPYMLEISQFDEARKLVNATVYTPATEQPIVEPEKPQATQNGIPIIGQ